MSSANLDLVRSIFAAWERGDYTSSEWADSEMEFVLIGSPEPGSWKGLNEIERWVRGYMSAWEEHRTEADEYRELDDERVVVLTHAGGRGQASGMEIGHQGGVHLFEIDQGKVMRLEFYRDRERAFAELGLDLEDR